jgi:6-phosphofructokinase
MTKKIGVLTAGGDTPGLNAALRGLGKAALMSYNFQLIGFKDGFRGLVYNNYLELDAVKLSGIISTGGTLLGTSRDKPHSMVVNGKTRDMTDAIIKNYQDHGLDALVCIGGGGTHKNVYRLIQKGLNIITIPKTIDNDVPYTDTTIGYDTAMSIATEAIDRLHTTAYSHHRIMLVETMGHHVGWLALGAGIAGGADVILIPEIPYDVHVVAESVLERYRIGKNFSIIAIAEGAVTKNFVANVRRLENQKKMAENPEERLRAEKLLAKLRIYRPDHVMRLAAKLEEITGLDSRVTILGHLQRGGNPSANDRLLATRLGTEAVALIKRHQYGVMVAARGNRVEPIPISKVVNKRKCIPINHPWIESARQVGTCLGD